MQWLFQWCVFCSWSPGTVCRWAMKTWMHTAHGWTTSGGQLEWALAWRYVWVGRPAWNNNWNVMDSNYGPVDIRRNTGFFLFFFSRTFLTAALEICKLCRFVAGRQVDHTCVGLAPTTVKTWTSIYDLGFTITTFCPVAILKIRCGRLRPPTCGNTISTIFALWLFDDCAIVLVSHPAPEMGCRQACGRKVPHKKNIALCMSSLRGGHATLYHFGLQQIDANHTRPAALAQAGERFFSRTLLTAECSVIRTVSLVTLLTLGTMLAIYIPAAPGWA